MQISDTFSTLKEKYNLSYIELERIIDSQFLFAKNCIEDRTIKTIKLTNLGKIKPSTFLIKNHGKFSKKS